MLSAEQPSRPPTQHSADALLDAMVDAGFVLLDETFERTKSIPDLMRRFLRFALEQPRLSELMFLRRRKSARKFPRDFRTGKSASFNVLVDLVKRSGFRAEFIRFYDRSVKRHLEGIRS